MNLKIGQRWWEKQEKFVFEILKIPAGYKESGYDFGRDMVEGFAITPCSGYGNQIHKRCYIPVSKNENTWWKFLPGQEKPEEI